MTVVRRVIWFIAIIAVTVVLSQVLANVSLRDLVDKAMDATSPAQDSVPDTFQPGDITTLKVDDTPHVEGYDRDLFAHWSSATEMGWPAKYDGCDVRDAALLRDGVKVRTDDYCDPIKGSWTDPYDGDLERSDSAIDIDHMVPLAEAWRAGAWQWSAAKREQYANDPAVVLATGLDTNRSKSDQTPDQWQPPARSYYCAYATHWVAVKDKYNLTVTTPEKAELKSMLATCDK